MAEENGKLFLKILQPKNLLWVLLVAVVYLLMNIGGRYDARIVSLEASTFQQQEKMTILEKDLEHIRELLEEIRTEQRLGLKEQKEMKVDLEVIKERLEER